MSGFEGGADGSHTRAAGVRVLLVAEQLHRRVPGGIGTMIRGLLMGLSEIQHSSGGGEGAGVAVDVTLYASRSPGSGDPLSQFDRRVIHSVLPGPLLTRAWDRRLLKAPRGFDVVHCASFAAPEARGGREVVVVHDLTWRQVPEAFSARSRSWHERGLRRVIGAGAILVVSCESVAAQLEQSGASRSRVRVIPFGSDHLPEPDRVEAQELLVRLGVKGDFLLSVGTLEPRKNLPRLFEAYRRASGRLGGLPLLVAGPSGWGPSLRPVEGVVFAGQVPDPVLVALYESARLLVYIPLAEGFGMPPLEAMHLGTPVVASPVPSTAGVGLEVDPRDVGQIAEALVMLCTDDEMRRHMVSAGRAHAARLTWAATARAHVELWESLR